MSSVGDILLDWVDRDAMCRVCLCPHPVAKWDLFDCTIVGRPIAEVLVEVAGVPIAKGDNYPTVCCSDCLQRVEAASRLREQCQQSNRRLAQIFETIGGVTVKQEAAVEEEEDVPMEEEEAPLTIAAIHGMPEEPPAVVGEGSSLNSTVISNFKVDGLEIRIEVPDLQSILQQSVEPSLLEPLVPSGAEAIPVEKPAAAKNKYECCGCPCTFDTEEEFEEHVQSFHEPRRVPLERVRKGFLECFRCYRMVKNMKVHHTRGNFCQVCSVLFPDYRELNKHYNSKHKIYKDTAQDRVIECCGCTHTFKTDKAFRDHVESFHKPARLSPEQLKHGYRECERCFKAVKRLKEHHVRDRYCKICCWQFTDDRAASIHYKNRHSKRKPSPDDVKICCGCAAPFPTIGALKIHSNQVHYQHKAAFDERAPFQCEICFDNFRDYGELDEHQTRYQKNNKQHRCGRCERTFFFLNSLRDHERSHAS